MPAIANGATLVLPRHKAARFTIAPDQGTLNSQRWNGDPALFTLAAGGSANEKRILPVGKLGVASLDFTSDGDPDQGSVFLSFGINVQIVPGLAVRLEFLYELQGAVPVNKLPQDNGTVDLPMNRTATLRVTAYDAQGDVVPLTAPIFTGSGTYFSIAATADPQKVLLAPIGTGPYDPVLLNADADVSSDTVPIAGSIQVRVTAAIATTLSATYALENP